VFASFAAVSALKARLAESEPCAPAMTDDFGALAPDLQLLDRGGAERVAGRHHHLAALGAEFAASLPMVVVLPEPLTPTTRMTNGFCGIDLQRLATGASTFSTSVATTFLTSSAEIALS
jgi:hypothetical protein